MFGSRAKTGELALVARNLGISLNAGVSVVRSLEMCARKTSPAMKQVLEDVIAQIKNGEDVASAMASHGGYFPELFIDMLRMGEQTGSLPETLVALARHYENNLRLKKEFLGQISMPIIQLTAAVLIIAGLIWILGWVASMNSGATIDIIGLGLTGTTGALTWLGAWAIGIASLFFAYKMAMTSLGSQKAIHRFLLNVPVVGHCMRSFAIARFSWAFHLTQQAGMPIDDSLDASLRATSNGAFIAAIPDVIRDINEGETLVDALARTQLFPVEFIETVHVAETSGTVPEQLDRLSPQFEEDARRSMKALTVAAGWTIWGLVAMFIIAMIFRIAVWYVGLINGALNDLNGI